jgi:sterol desaturase/sphingolipid hydroxylase (fatty acid hydroxylase superfamily)
MPWWQTEQKWAFGLASLFLGLLALGGALAFRYPQHLTTAEIRSALPLVAYRGLLAACLLGALVAGLGALAFDRGKRTGALGIALAAVAWLHGGWNVPARPVGAGASLGLDWLLLSILVLAVLFIPLERAFQLRPQAILRRGWQTDLWHFAVSHLLVSFVVLATVWPAHTFFAWGFLEPLRDAVASTPLALQIVLAIVVADFMEYAVHRAMHKLPLLWRFHAVHHSSTRMDWLAGSRLHLGDVILLRACVYAALFVAGFGQTAVAGYVTFAALHAAFIHANVRLRAGWLEHVVVLPRFHHWHHGRAPEAIDKNFAVHLPWIDRLFGTHHLPIEWPEEYGIDGDPVPDGYVDQLGYPFRRRK